MQVEYHLFACWWQQQKSGDCLFLLLVLLFKLQSISWMQCLKKVYKFLCCISDPIFPTPYNFQFGTKEQIEYNRTHFQSNFVRTSKYRWYDFLPKSLLQQFYRLANIYFLVIGILQSIPAISPLGPLTAWAPLIVVLGISMLREGYEDYQRYKSDHELNFQLKTLVLREGVFVQVEWSEVVIGEIVRVQQEELFPVDLILISSSIEGGTAFIETASLDGEKNLKPRNAFPSTQALNTQSSLRAFAGTWQGTVPDKELHNFSSNLVWDGQTLNFYKDKQLLYRGARLKNTKWIYGLCIYTGRNTKIMMNSDSSSEKMSQIEIKVNYILAIILVLQICLCLILAILDGAFLNQFQNTYYYLAPSSNSPAGDATLMWCTYFVLINTMIPISLIVSIEVVKMSQSYFIDKDQLMYSEFRKKRANVKSASLNEELGQIEYVFTDKTGTLTMNLMEFKIAVIGRRMYGDLGLIINDPARPPQIQKGFHDKDLSLLLSKGSNNTPIDDMVVKDREGNQSVAFKQMKDLAEEYLIALAVTHEVVAETDKNGRKFYQGPSPDEITLVDAAKQMGFEFQKATQDYTHILIRGQQKKFELLQVFAFNSDRKRMSVVVRSGGVIKLYTKGADSIIKSRLAASQKLNLDDELNRFSKIGLRTLLIGMRIISEAEYKNFKQKSSSLPPGANKEAAIEQLVSDLERGIYLIGATAVLDRLQDDVPQTIRDLIRANIKVWMLTGDKMETAQNIAKSCNLIQSHFQILRYSCKNQDGVLQALKTMSAKVEQLNGLGQPKALLIEGEDLTPIIGDQDNEKQLANIAKYCEAVVCCRLLPIQKAEVVRIVRTRLQKITLSIGDGANDVPMIKTAHIGVGLYGEEGMGAVQASDYALPEFRMLWRLLLVHGRWNYLRISEMILYFFYKNMLFTIPQFIFAFYCGFSGQTIFDDIYISLYNLAFTSFPLVIRAVLEQDVYYVRPSHNQKLNTQQPSTSELVASHQLKSQLSKYIPKDYQMNKYLYRLFPKIYFIGQQSCIFNYTNFTFWILQSVVESTLISLFSLYILSSASVDSSGYSTDLWLVSLTIFTSVICVVTFKLATHTKFWSILLFVCIIGLSLGLYEIYMWISNYYFSNYVKGTTWMFYTNAQTYFIVLFCCCLVLWVDGIVLSIDFQNGGYSSRMRQLIEEEKEDNKERYRELSIHSSEVNTHLPKNEVPL